MSGILMEDTSQNDSSVAAPAAAAPAAAPAASSKPTSASAAMESAARSAATPASASGVKPNGSAGSPGQTPQVAAPVAQPAQPATGQPQTKGPIPFDAHETALKNAREKSRTEVMQQFAWANGIDATVAQRALALAKRLDSDPRTFAKQLQAELSESDPDASLPAADIKSSNGVEAYSAKSVLAIVDQVRNQLRAEMKGQIQPFVDERTEAQQKAEQQKATEAAIEAGRTVIRDGIAHARTLAHFKENEPAISAKLGEISPEVRSKVGLVGAMYMAYAAVLADLVGKASTAGAESTITDLKRKAQAGSGNASPGGPVMGGGKPKLKDGDVGGLSRHMQKLSDSISA